MSGRKFEPAAVAASQLWRGTRFSLHFIAARRAENISEPTGGEGGIRTPDRLAPMPHFECGAIGHSATSPGAMTGG